MAKNTIQNRETKACQDAMDAFWAVIAKAFPEATTGDLGVLEATRFERACEDAVEAWTESNVSGEAGEASMDREKFPLPSVTREQLACLLVGLRMLENEIMRLGGFVSSPEDAITEEWPQFYEEGLACLSLPEINDLRELINCGK